MSYGASPWSSLCQEVRRLYGVDIKLQYKAFVFGVYNLTDDCAMIASFSSVSRTLGVSVGDVEVRCGICTKLVLKREILSVPAKYKFNGGYSYGVVTGEGVCNMCASLPTIIGKDDLTSLYSTIGLARCVRPIVGNHPGPSNQFVCDAQFVSDLHRQMGLGTFRGQFLGRSKKECINEMQRYVLSLVTKLEFSNGIDGLVSKAQSDQLRYALCCHMLRRHSEDQSPLNFDRLYSMAPNVLREYIECNYVFNGFYYASVDQSRIKKAILKRSIYPYLGPRICDELSSGFQCVFDNGAHSDNSTTDTGSSSSGPDIGNLSMG